MTINISAPNDNVLSQPRITVIGVGGAGGNAVNNMISANLEGVEFIAANTDNQALHHSLSDRILQLGTSVTRGLGAGANPDIGRAAAEEVVEMLAAELGDSNMVFITAGMGGGTGTGAAPVIARVAREREILTVGVVTKPFHFEGKHRMRTAEQGIEELSKYVDTLIIIPNQNLFRIANEKTTFADAFHMADTVLQQGVRGVTDLMVMPGLINLDFADIRTVMREMGKAMMGTGEATGEKRAIEAAELAISNPLLDDISVKGANGVLINITGGMDMTLYEVDEAANRVRDEVDADANIIFGAIFDEKLEGSIRVSVVATGINAMAVTRNPGPRISLVSDRTDDDEAAEVAAEAEAAPLPFVNAATAVQTAATPATGADVPAAVAMQTAIPAATAAQAAAPAGDLHGETLPLPGMEKAEGKGYAPPMSDAAVEPRGYGQTATPTRVAAPVGRRNPSGAGERSGGSFWHFFKGRGGAARSEPARPSEATGAIEGDRRAMPSGHPVGAAVQPAAASELGNRRNSLPEVRGDIEDVPAFLRRTAN